LNLSRSALVSHVAEHFDLRDARTVKPCARCLFPADISQSANVRFSQEAEVAKWQLLLAQVRARI
jgi:uncharacterized protein YcbX